MFVTVRDCSAWILKLINILNKYQNDMLKFVKLNVMNDPEQVVPRKGKNKQHIMEVGKHI